VSNNSPIYPHILNTSLPDLLEWPRNWFRRGNYRDFKVSKHNMSQGKYYTYLVHFIVCCQLLCQFSLYLIRKYLYVYVCFPFIYFSSCAKKYNFRTMLVSRNGNVYFHTQSCYFFMLVLLSWLDPSIHLYTFLQLFFLHSFILITKLELSCLVYIFMSSLC
jgi:hypothetical protein